MIFIHLIFLLWPVLGWSVEVVPYIDLVKRIGVHYKKFSEEPFTGKVTGMENGFYKNGRKEDGKWVVFQVDGRLREKGRYKNGYLFDGLIYFYKNGELEKTKNYKNGVYVGETKYEYHNNGNLKKKGSYKDGKLFDGFIYFFGKKGRVEKTENFKNGQYVGETIYEYHNNGRLKKKGNFKDGLENGIWEYFHKNGRLRSKTTYKNGVLDGLYENYFLNGQLESKGDFKNGRESGLWEELGIGRGGKLQRIKGSYESGIKTGDWHYYHGTTKKIKEQGSLKDGKKDGVWKYFGFYDGNIDYIREYSNGNLINEKIFKSKEKLEAKLAERRAEVRKISALKYQDNIDGYGELIELARELGKLTGKSLKNELIFFEQKINFYQTKLETENSFR